MTIGEASCKRILQLCKTNEITLNGLCTTCGITQSTLNNIKFGKSKNPTISTIKKICDGLSITIIEFFDDPLFENLEPEIGS